MNRQISDSKYYQKIKAERLQKLKNEYQTDDKKRNKILEYERDKYRKKHPNAKKYQTEHTQNYLKIETKKCLRIERNNITFHPENKTKNEIFNEIKHYINYYLKVCSYRLVTDGKTDMMKKACFITGNETLSYHVLLLLNKLKQTKSVYDNESGEFIKKSIRLSDLGKYYQIRFTKNSVNFDFSKLSSVKNFFNYKNMSIIYYKNPSDYSDFQMTNQQVIIEVTRRMNGLPYDKRIWNIPESHPEYDLVHSSDEIE